MHERTALVSLLVMSEERFEEGTKGVVLDWVIKTFDPWLESRKASNTLIIFFLLLAAIPIVGVGLATTRTILPRDRIAPPEYSATSTDFLSRE